MRICIVGNSHTAMLINALREDDLGLDVTMFAVPGSGPVKAVQEGSRLIARDDYTQSKLSRLGMPHEVDLAAFDGVVFVGSTVSAFGAMAMLAGFRVWGWPGTTRALEEGAVPFAPALRQQLLSRQALAAGLMAQIEEGLTFRLLAGLRAASDVPALILPQPFPAARLLKMTGKPPIFRRVVEDGEGALVAEALHDAHERVFGRFARTTVLRQPARSAREGMLTRRAYSLGATRLNTDLAQPRDDILHANAALGALYLRRIRARLEELEKSP